MIKRKIIYGKWYHGTDYSTAQNLFAKKINITNGGGELGQGFYMGNFMHQAKQWAYYKNNENNIPSSIVTFEFTPWISLKYQLIGFTRGLEIYANLNKKGTQRSHVFGYDFVLCKVLGKILYNFYQLKWESTKGQFFLNNNAIITLL